MSEDCRPILNGKRTLSLDLLIQCGREATEQEQLQPPVDWPATLKSVGFDQVEIRFLLKKIDGTTLAEMPSALGMDEAEVRRIRQRIGAKLIRIRSGRVSEPIYGAHSHSRQTSFKETLPSGHKVWALSSLDEDFLDVVNEEKQILMKMFYPDPQKSRF